jgi:hypothetical protein
MRVLPQRELKEFTQGGEAAYGRQPQFRWPDR